jgi:ATP-binding cassette, subfamily B (MDR/TAP), member 1
MYVGDSSHILKFRKVWERQLTMSQTLSTRVRRDMLSSLLRQDLRFFDRPENTVGALSSRLDANPQAIQELMGINISFAVISAVSVVACCILSLVVAWKVGLIGVFVGLPPLLLSGWLRLKLEARLNSIINKAFLRSASLASESVRAIRTVSSLAIEDNVLQRYTDELDVAVRSCTPPLFHVMIWFAFTQATEHFVLALGFWYAANTRRRSLYDMLTSVLLTRWGSKLVNDGEITFYQFMVAFMGVYFSGMASGTLFSFAGSKVCSSVLTGSC